MNHKLTTSVLYELDKFTNYSITLNPVNNSMYVKNPHFGWLRCHWTEIEDLPSKRDMMLDKMLENK